LLARQIDLICAAQLTSIKVTLAAHNGGYTRCLQRSPGSLGTV
jgi:hypothetical protein